MPYNCGGFPRSPSDSTIGWPNPTGMALRDHDVSQNHAAFLEAIESEPPFCIVDLGCGPGRDLRCFKSLGHDAIGLDGSKELVAMARRISGCEVLHQDFLALELPESRFDGVFANASLFHVPSQELPRVLRELHTALKPDGVLFCSKPERKRRGGIERRSLWLLFRFRHLAQLRHRCRIQRGETLLPPARAPPPQAAVAGNRLAQAPRTGSPRALIQPASRTRRRCWRRGVEILVMIAQARL